MVFNCEGFACAFLKLPNGNNYTWNSLDKLHVGSLSNQFNILYPIIAKGLCVPCFVINNKNSATETQPAQQKD